MGARTNHWFHSDQIYRTFFTLTMLCGCQGVNGGGWAHYVGQEKVRPLAGFQTLAFAMDWQRPTRHMTGTSFFYLHSDQWRYESFGADELASPLGRGRPDRDRLRHGRAEGRPAALRRRGPGRSAQLPAGANGVAGQPAPARRGAAGRARAGSYLVLGQGTSADKPQTATAFEKVRNGSSATAIRMRSRADIARFFGDFEFVDPGLVYVSQRRPGSPADVPADPSGHADLVAAARKDLTGSDRGPRRARKQVLSAAGRRSSEDLEATGQPRDREQDR